MLHNLKYLPRDTSIEAARVMFAVFRQMPVAKRLRLMAEMNEFHDRRRLARIRQEHPALSDEAARLTLIRERLGPDLFAKAYPHASVRQ